MKKNTRIFYLTVFVIMLALLVVLGFLFIESNKNKDEIVFKLQAENESLSNELKKCQAGIE